MASEYILLFLSKYRYKIIIFTLLFFAASTAVSYYFTGRTYKSSIDFYIVNSFFTETSLDEKSNKYFPSSEEHEIIGSICKSNEIIEAVVNNDKLINHYQCNSQNQAIEKLKNNTTIAIGKKGKITIHVEDLNNIKAQQIANHLINEVYTTYLNRCKQARENSLEDLESRSKHFSLLRENILNEPFINQNITKEILETPKDSLDNYEVINKIKNKSNLEIKEVLYIISNLKRLAELDNKIFILNDQINKYQQGIQALKRNNLILLNNTVPYNKNVPMSEHFKNGLNYTLLFNAIWISLLMLYKHYKKEIDLFIGRD